MTTTTTTSATAAATTLESISDIQKAFDEYKNRLKRDVYEYEDLHLKMRQMYGYKLGDYEEPKIKIVNIVVSTNIKEIDISRVKNDINTEYYPKQFPGFVHRMHDPKASILLFKTGRLICTGIKNLSDAYSSVDAFTKKFNCVLAYEVQEENKEEEEEQEQVKVETRIFEEGDIAATVIKFKPNKKLIAVNDPEADPHIDPIKVQNLVISIDFGYYIDLEEAAFSIPRAIYESEQFPGIIYRNLDPRAVFLMFTSGKTICVGTNNLENAYIVTYYLRDILMKNNLFINRK